MAIQLDKLKEYLIDLKIVFEDSVANGKPFDDVNKVLQQIKHIERLIEAEEAMGKEE